MATKKSVFEKYLLLQTLSLHMQGHGRRPGQAPNTPWSDKSKGQGRVLALLKLKDGVSTKELATILDLRVSSLNETLAKMEKAGLVERRPSEADKRVMLAYLAEKGKAQQQDEPVENPHAFLLEGFSEEELDALEGFLDRMIANIEKELGPEMVEAMKAAAKQREEMIQKIMDEGTFEGKPPAGFGGFPGFGGFGRFPGFGGFETDRTEGR